MLLLSISFVQLTLAQPVISYQPFITGLTVPVDVVSAGDGSNRLFVVQQNGLIRVWNGTSLLATPFLNVSNLIIYTGDERGLLSMAFHPAYATNGYFFIYYNSITAPNITSINVARYQVSANPNVANPAGTVIISIPKPAGRTNHNGGDLNFGADGNLYFATGDGGGANDPDNLAQSGTSLLGKMLRINVNDFTTTYTIPSSNPYVNDPVVRDEIWALGLRNPYRWSFDRLTNDMWIGDVGQGAKEEVNYRPGSSTGGENYGWRCYEGSIPTPGVPSCSPANYVPPVFDYDNPNGGAPPPSSVTGGFVYRGPDYPQLVGYYMAADVYSGTVYLIKPNGSGGWTTTPQTGLQNLVVAFGEDEVGRLYAVSQGTGTVYKIVAASEVPLPVTLTHFSVKHFAAYNALKWVTDVEQNTTRFGIEYSRDNRKFERAGQVAATRNRTGSSYTFQHNITTTSPLYYRLAIEDDNGQVKYSSAVKVLVDNSDRIKIYPTTIRNSVLNISLPQPVTKLQLINVEGKLCFEKGLNNVTGFTSVPLPSLAKGMYVVQVISDAAVHREKIVIQ